MEDGMSEPSNANTMEENAATYSVLSSQIAEIKAQMDVLSSKKNSIHRYFGWEMVTVFIALIAFFAFVVDSYFRDRNVSSLNAMNEAIERLRSEKESISKDMLGINDNLSKIKAGLDVTKADTEALQSKVEQAAMALRTEADEHSRTFVSLANSWQSSLTYRIDRSKSDLNTLISSGKSDLNTLISSGKSDFKNLETYARKIEEDFGTHLDKKVRETLDSEFRRSIDLTFKEKIYDIIKPFSIALTGPLTSVADFRPTYNNTSENANLVAGRRSEPFTLLDVFRVSDFPKGSVICGLAQHERIFRNLIQSTGGAFRYERRHLPYAIESLKSGSRDGLEAACDYVVWNSRDQGAQHVIGDMFSKTFHVISFDAASSPKD
jgi:hypothetical protein